MIENSKEGLKLVIRDRNNTMIYQGEFEELNRHGKGIEQDEHGKLKYEGYWNKGELTKIQASNSLLYSMWYQCILKTAAVSSEFMRSDIECAIEWSRNLTRYS